MNVAMRTGLIAGASVALAGCFGLASLNYRGDGTLTDHGVLAYASRYKVDLGPIDTSVLGVRSYQLQGLPYGEFSAGIEVLDAEPNKDSRDPKYRGRIALELRNATGEVVIAESAPVEEWTRSYGIGGTISHLYRSGASTEKRFPNGDMQHIKQGIKASGGWGTYFNSDPTETYTLRVEVMEPLQPSRPTRVTLIGWDRA